jgi:hypothetical protein
MQRNPSLEPFGSCPGKGRQQHEWPGASLGPWAMEYLEMMGYIMYGALRCASLLGF